MPFMTNDGKGLYEFGPFRLDPSQRLLLRDDHPIPLQPKAFDTLLVLVRNSEKVVLKDDLLNAVWADTFVEESNLTQNIFVLRKALGDADGGRRFIITIPGRGYRLTEKARFVPQPDDMVLHTVTSITWEPETEKEAQKETKLSPDTQPEGLPKPAAAKKRWGLILLLVLTGVVTGALAVRAFLAPEPMPKVLRSVQLTQFGRAEPFGPVLTDGSRLYFTERIGGARGLAEVGEQGGEPALISTSLTGIALLDIDRSRSRLLVGTQVPDASSSFSPLWVVPTSGGSGRRLGDTTGADAAWSPDGQTIAYDKESDLFMVRDDAQQARKVFSAPGVIEYPRWSPDGRRLSFTVRDITAARSLWEIASDGSNPHPLNLGWKARHSRYDDGESCGDWTPDGRFFVFRSQHDAVHSLWAIREDTGWFHKGRGVPVQLYSSPRNIGQPRFSIDGTKIFFVDYQERRELVRYDSVRKTFVPYLGGIPARLLSFSRDGQWVAYRNDADQSLWRSRSDGTQALQLTFSPIRALHSTWSPDGKKIAFQADQTLYTIPSEGGKPEALLPDDVLAGQPNWSPDGKSLLFTRWAKSVSRDLAPSIYLLDLSTREIRMIPGSDGFETAQWSPDGKYAAAADKKDHKLMLFDFARQQWLELADGTPYGRGMRWSADGRYIYYQHLYDGEEQPIFRVRVSNHKVEQIASSRQILRADVLSYSMTGLTPDDSPLASLIHRNSDVFALELDVP